MDSYIPLWSSIVDSSLWSEPDFVVKVFLTMMVKRDMDDIVRAGSYRIHIWSKKTEEEVIEALKILSSPDTKRLEPQEYDGRRIEKVDGGWLILNGAYYRKMMQEANTRSYKARKQREYRSKQPPTPLPGEQEFDKKLRNGASETQLDEVVNKHLPSST